MYVASFKNAVNEIKSMQYAIPETMLHYLEQLAISSSTQLPLKYMTSITFSKHDNCQLPFNRD